MQLFAARIALLAYLVGGLAIPALHQHGMGAHLTGYSHAGHAHGGHSHAGHAHSHAGQADASQEPVAGSEPNGECCHTPPPADCQPVAEGPAAEPSSDGAAVQPTTVAATLPQSATCGDDCVICGFLGSAQASLADAPPMLPTEPLRRIAAASSGPGFAAADLRIDRLRGPPMSVIVG